MASTERDNAGLEADIGITLGKLTKQLASAEARMVKTAKKFETDFANANRKVSRGFDQTSKRAQGSATAMGKEMDRLRAKYDPIFAASKRYEAELQELNRAHKVGALSVGQYESALENLNLEYERSANGARALTGGLAGVANGSRISSGSIQNVAFQVGDFATQVGAGTSASIALGQQLPQLLGGFGVLGAVMGAVVAVGVPLTRVLIENAGASVDLEEKIEALEQAVSEYSTAVELAVVPTDELRKKYGAATEAAQEFISALAQLNERAATDALSQTLSEIALQFGDLSDTLVNVGGVFPIKEIEDTARKLADQLEITEEAALGVAEGLRAILEAEGPAMQAQAAADLLATMEATLGPMSEMSDGARALAEQLSKAGLQAGEVQANIETTNFGIQDMITGLAAASGNLSTMVGNAASLGDNMLRAAKAAWDFVGAQGQAQRVYSESVGRGRGGDPREFGGTAAEIQRNDPQAQLAASTAAIAATQRKAAAKAAKASKRGGGGAKSKSETSLFETGERAIQSLERQIEMIGKSASEVAGLTLKYKLLDEAKKRGIDLDARQSKTGQTVREEIDRQAEAVERLTERYSQAKERAEFFDDANRQLKEGLLDAAIEGESLSGVLADVAKKFARAALEAALFNEGIFAQSGNGGGFLGSLIGSIFGGGSKKPVSMDGGGYTGSGPRTGGIDGKGGFPAILHPNETVVDHSKGGGMGGNVSVSYQIDARGADVGAVQRIEVALAKTKAEMPSMVLTTLRDAKKRNIPV